MFTTDHRRILGEWLHRHRGWGLVPLLAIGLFFDVRVWPAGRGNFMMVAGAAGILFGTLLRIVCSTFISHREAHDPGRSHGLITNGPYAISRNPAYLGEAAIALGIAMMSRMPWFVLVTLIGGLLVLALVIEWEEETLRHLYGKTYEDYCHIVPRWFSWSRMLHPDCYLKTRGSVRLLAALRAESGTLLVGLLAILAFITKADLEILFFRQFTP